jgi:hypothetical protein
MLCSPVKVNQHFEGMYFLHLQAQRVSKAKTEHKVGIIQKLELFVSCKLSDESMAMNDEFQISVRK